MASALALLGAQVSAAERPLNIIFLLADDLGYGDLSCYGHPYSRTPNLDRLAREGTRFEQFCVTGITCCPSRTGFMTSKFPATFQGYPANAGFGARLTVTALLKQAGYATGHFGKWHIGPESTSGTYGIDTISEGEAGNRKTSGRDTPVYSAAIKFNEQHKDVPFYVNVWGHISHNPVNPLPLFAERFKNLTVHEADFPAPMREKFALAKSRGGDVSAGMRKYLGDLSSLDDDVGRLLNRLDELGLADRTIVVFSSDHGSPSMRPPGEEKVRPKKNRALKEEPGDPGGGREDLTLNLMGFNGGLKGGKHGMYEGGVRVPFIIRWPGRVPAGRVDGQSVISGIDWLPTLCSIAGVEFDAGSIDGEDVSKAWLGQAPHVRTKPLFWKVSNPGAPVGIRESQWKMHHPTRQRGEIELYDLAIDRGETRNVAPENPDVVQRLATRVKQWNATLPTTYDKTEDKQE